MKTRSEIDIQYKWKLEDLIENQDSWQQRAAQMAEQTQQIAQFEGKLGQLSQLKACFDLLYGARQTGEQLYAYSRMRRDEDNAATQYQALTDQAQGLLVKLSTASAYVVPELLTLDESVLDSYIESDELHIYRVDLQEVKRQRPHTLSAEGERLVAMTGEMGATASTVFDMLTDADMSFPQIEDEHGNMVPVTHGNYSTYRMNRDRNVRRRAFESMHGTYKTFENTIPAIYSGSVKGDLFYAQAAKHTSAMDSTLFPDAIPTQVYHNLVSAVRDSLPDLHRYVLLCAKLNGIDDPQMYDIYLPAVKEFEINLPFDQAYDLVVDCLKPLGSEYQAQLREAKAGRWIDVYETKGKSSGAYSWGVYGCHPFVLLNYNDNLDGLLTVAHEMGHAMHSFYSNAAQPYPTADYSLFVAEVASTVNEVLVMLELLERYSEPAAQQYLLYNLLESFRTTVFRQTMFAEFEQKSHEMAEQGQALTGESLNAVYDQLNRDYYAPIGQPELMRYEWMEIPHFYRAFYVYQYATGFSAAMALAAKIRNEGAGAVEQYKQFLKAGSSLPPIEALKLAGVDMSSPEPVRQALKEFANLLSRFESVAQ